MTPASKKEFAIITKCETKIQHLEENIKDMKEKHEKNIKELKEEMRKQKKDETDNQQHINDKRLATYLTIASIFGGILVIVLERIIS